MTKDDLSIIPTGRELDEIVAEKVMGWVDFWKSQHHLMGYPPQEQSLGVGYDERHPVPQYSSDISAAWEVLQKMKEKLFSKRGLFLKHLQDVVSVGLEEGKVIAFPDVIWFMTPEAICKSAVLAVMES